MRSSPYINAERDGPLVIAAILVREVTCQEGATTVFARWLPKTSEEIVKASHIRGTAVPILAA